MDVLLNDDEAAVQRAAAEFLSNEVHRRPRPPGRARPRRASRATLWAKVAELGWLGISLPEACGGQELPLSYLGLLFEELGRQLAPMPMLEHHGPRPHPRPPRHARPSAPCSAKSSPATLTLTYAVQEPNCRWSLRRRGARRHASTATTLVLTGEKSFVDNFRSAGAVPGRVPHARRQRPGARPGRPGRAGHLHRGPRHHRRRRPGDRPLRRCPRRR